MKHYRYSKIGLFALDYWFSVIAHTSLIFLFPATNLQRLILNMSDRSREHNNKLVTEATQDQQADRSKQIR